MKRSEYNDMIEPFVARLTARPTKRTFDDGSGSKRASTTWDLEFKLDGEPIEDDFLSDHFTGFSTLRAAAQAEVAWPLVVRAEIQNEYYMFIDGQDVSTLTMKMVTG